jgi:hypothetical protein
MTTAESVRHCLPLRPLACGPIRRRRERVAAASAGATAVIAQALTPAVASAPYTLDREFIVYAQPDPGYSIIALTKLVLGPRDRLLYSTRGNTHRRRRARMASAPASTSRIHAAERPPLAKEQVQPCWGSRRSPLDGAASRPGSPLDGAAS